MQQKVVEQRRGRREDHDQQSGVQPSVRLGSQLHTDGGEGKVDGQEDENYV
jgi:hypothetical protein